LGFFLDKLGANPIELITRSTGTWTLTFLLITLAVTPLRRMSGWHWLLKLRRMLGLFAFFYACLHFTTTSGSTSSSTGRRSGRTS
jgi:sulfoxide reductase heme-binding subunit YedZ